MIYVDVFVPVINKVYDFILDENATVGVLTDEIVEIITQREQCVFSGRVDEIMLCLEETATIMPKNRTLFECGVHTGSRIIFG